MKNEVRARRSLNYAGLIAGSALLASAAWAQTRTDPPSAGELAVTRMRDTPILHERDIAPVTVYEWERDGKVMNAFPGDGKTPPYDAAKLELRLYNLPTGQLRRLEFPRGARTPPHLNDSDIVIYSLAGRQVQIVNEEADYDRPGDVTFQPFGVNHHSETVVAAERLEFAFSREPGLETGPVFLHAADTQEQAAADALKGGTHRVLLGRAADAAPPTTRFHARIFRLPGHDLVHAVFPRGEILPAHTATEERLVYVVRGRLRVTLGDVTDEVGPGDLYRVAAGRTFGREALEETEVVDLNGSKAPPR